MEWVECFITSPHAAYLLEKRLREELDTSNKTEVAAGIRKLDVSPALDGEAAYRRLLDHQISELAMLAGHMDGLGRAMTMLHLELEDAVKTADGYLTTRPGLFEIYKAIGIGKAALTANELRLNPVLLEQIQSGKKRSPVSGAEAAATGEF